MRKKKETKSGVDTMSDLPQYLFSLYMEDRILDAGASGKKNVPRVKYREGTKIVRKREERTDLLDYFIENTKHFRKEFIKELRFEEMRWKKIWEFCRIIKIGWYDGARSVIKKDKDVQQLMASVRKYLLSQGVTNIHLIVSNDIDTGVESNFSVEEIKIILEVNKRLTSQYFNEWIRLLAKTINLDTSHIYFKRGINLKEKRTLGKKGNHKEWALINSYTISQSVAEQFSKLGRGKAQMLLHTCYPNIEERILFFSPFIPGMYPKQLEFGIIPQKAPLRYKYQGMVSRIYEYIIDNPIDI